MTENSQLSQRLEAKAKSVMQWRVFFVIVAVCAVGLPLMIIKLSAFLSTCVIVVAGALAWWATGFLGRHYTEKAEVARQLEKRGLGETVG